MSIEIRDEPREGIQYVAAGEGTAYWQGESALVTCLAASDGTDGRYSLFEVRDAAGDGPPMHLHTREDEAYCILEGEYEIHVPDSPVLHLSPGAYVLVKRGTVHTYKCAGPGWGRMLVMASPGGLERFFAELGVLAIDRTTPPQPSGPPDIGQMVAIAAKHGIEVVGPPPE